MTRLPNRKILFLLVFAPFVFAGWFFFYKGEGNNLRYMAENNNSNNGETLELTARKALSIDSDSDGLDDWEEALWKTDPKNPDTDGDNTPDGEETAFNRDPLKPGPDDKNPSPPSFENLSMDNESFSQDDTMTGNYARKFLSDYLLLKNQKGTLSEVDKGNLITSLVTDISSAPVEEVDNYAISNARTSADNSENAIKEYSNEVKKIFIDENFKFENELVVFERLVNSTANGEENNKDAKELNNIAAVYKTAAKKLISVKTPASLAGTHIEVVNGLNNISSAVKNMAELSADPIKAIGGMKVYQREIQIVYDKLQKLQSVFSEYGISLF